MPGLAGARKVKVYPAGPDELPSPSNDNPSLISQTSRIELPHKSRQKHPERPTIGRYDNVVGVIAIPVIILLLLTAGQVGRKDNNLH